MKLKRNPAKIRKEKQTRKKNKYNSNNKSGHTQKTLSTFEVYLSISLVFKVRFT